MGALNTALEDSLPAVEVLSGADVNRSWELFKKTFMNTVHRFVPNSIGQILQVLGPPCVGLLLFGLGLAVQSPSCIRKGTILRCKSCDSQMAEGCRAFEDPPQVAIIVMQKEGSETVSAERSFLVHPSFLPVIFYAGNVCNRLC